jgi:hypothetical protein
MDTKFCLHFPLVKQFSWNLHKIFNEFIILPPQLWVHKNELIWCVLQWSHQLIYWPVSFFYFSINNTMLHHALVVEQVIQMCTYFLGNFGARSIFLTIRSPTFIRTSSSGFGLKLVPIYSSDGFRNLFLNNFYFILFGFQYS